MGCHTWFYVHLPEHEDEFEKLLMKGIRTYFDDAYDSFLQGEESGYYGTEVFNHFKSELKDWLEDPHVPMDDPGYIEYKGYSTMTWDEYHGRVERTLNELKKLLDDNKPLSEIFKYHEGLCMFDADLIEAIIDSDIGLYIFYDNKIYLECGNELISPYVDRHHDLFRIHWYDAPDCHSYEETLVRVKEYNNLEDTEIKCKLTEEQKSEIYRFFSKYDSIIHFG